MQVELFEIPLAGASKILVRKGLKPFLHNKKAREITQQVGIFQQPAGE
jgi:hypothetical protein